MPWVYTAQRRHQTMQRFSNMYGCQSWHAAMICWTVAYDGGPLPIEPSGSLAEGCPAGRCPQERHPAGAFVAIPNVILKVAARTPHPVRQPRKSVSTRALFCHALGRPMPGRTCAGHPWCRARANPANVERQGKSGQDTSGDVGFCARREPWPAFLTSCSA